MTSRKSATLHPLLDPAPPNPPDPPPAASTRPTLSLGSEEADASLPSVSSPAPASMHNNPAPPNATSSPTSGANNRPKLSAPASASAFASSLQNKRARRGHTKRELDEIRDGGDYKDALALVQLLLSDKDASMFAQPVFELWEEEELPGYLDVVEKPMDLGTVKSNVRSLQYVVERDNALHFDCAAFLADVRLVFRNCMNYNDPKSEYYRVARRLLLQADRKFASRTAKHSHAVPAPSSTKSMPCVIPGMSSSKKSAKNEELLEQTGGEVASDRNLLSTESAPRKKSRSAQGRPRRTVRPSEAQLEDSSGGTAASSDSPMAGKPPAGMPRDSRGGVPAPGPQRAGQARGEDVVLTGVRATEGGPKAGKWANTSSVSSDEQELAAGESAFAFVSTVGMEKRRGRKSALVQDLETRHGMLMKRRRILIESSAQLEKFKQSEMSYEEKEVLCERVSNLNFVQMKAVVDIIVRGMNRKDLLEHEEIDLCIDKIDNAVLREVQAFLESSTVVAAHGTLHGVEQELAHVETLLVDHRFQKIASD